MLDFLGLEIQRGEQRKKGKISYDCFHLKMKQVDFVDKVYCKKGYLLTRSRDGTATLTPILRGILLGTCKDCLDYDEEDNGS